MTARHGNCSTRLRAAWNSAAPVWERYNGLVARYDAAKEKLAAIAEERISRKAVREGIGRFIAELEAVGGSLAEFDEALWHATVESVTVGQREITFKWRDSLTTTIPLK